ncbi:uncharacterized protein LOC132189295 [Corylus avellana]|uniref:uncharacterized protein LOC132189295 n=1 Tax=Corylus avellana TaxID=13451 RepID=UPI001E227727|nr:uncharacterized protein LOC132189295 [Corylus avellana]
MYKATHSCGNPAVSTQNDTVTNTLRPPPIPCSPHRNDPTATIAPTDINAPIMIAAAASWLGSRRIRYCLLVLCSPLLLPFLCAAFPLLCAAELCLRRIRLRRRKEEPLIRCEEGSGRGVEEEEEGVGLLQRYLEDQMLLVGSVYDCGDDSDDGNVGFQATANGSSSTPLLG